MKLSELTEVGYIRKPHGLQGQLKVQFDSYYIDHVTGLNALIIEKGEDFLPFFIEEFVPNSQPPLLKFESIETKEDAVKLSGKTIYAISEQLPQIKENQLELLEGINVYNEQDFQIGQVEEILEMPSQLILRIEGEHGKILLPFHEDFIIELIPEANRLQLQVPEGLLDIYS